MACWASLNFSSESRGSERFLLRRVKVRLGRAEGCRGRATSVLLLGVLSLQSRLTRVCLKRKQGALPAMVGEVPAGVIGL